MIPTLLLTSLACAPSTGPTGSIVDSGPGADTGVEPAAERGPVLLPWPADPTADALPSGTLVTDGEWVVSGTTEPGLFASWQRNASGAWNAPELWTSMRADFEVLEAGVLYTTEQTSTRTTLWAYDLEDERSWKAISHQVRSFSAAGTGLVWSEDANVFHVDVRDPQASLGKLTSYTGGIASEARLTPGGRLTWFHRGSGSRVLYTTQLREWNVQQLTSHVDHVGHYAASDDHVVWSAAGLYHLKMNVASAEPELLSTATLLDVGANQHMLWWTEYDAAFALRHSDEHQLQLPDHAAWKAASDEAFVELDHSIYDVEHEVEYDPFSDSTEVLDMDNGLTVWRDDEGVWAQPTTRLGEL